MATVSPTCWPQQSRDRFRTGLPYHAVVEMSFPPHAFCSCFFVVMLLCVLPFSCFFGFLFLSFCRFASLLSSMFLNHAPICTLILVLYLSIASFVLGHCSYCCGGRAYCFVVIVVIVVASGGGGTSRLVTLTAVLSGWKRDSVNSSRKSLMDTGGFTGCSPARLDHLHWFRGTGHHHSHCPSARPFTAMKLWKFVLSRSW